VKNKESEMAVEETIGKIFSWLNGKKAGEGFSISSLVELQTGEENPAFGQLAQQSPHMQEMISQGWILVDGRNFILTQAGYAEMRRRTSASP
jgi:hypothetical protein